jgi:hypothetical protein
MNWSEHILSTKAKAEKMNIIKCLAHTKWGADLGNFLTIHKMIIISTLRYGLRLSIQNKKNKPLARQFLREVSPFVD